MSGVDLDRLAAGCASVSWHPWSAFPGALVGIRALTFSQSAEARRAARLRVGNLPAGKARDAALRHEEAVEAVVRATLTVNDAGEECPLLTMDEARGLDAETLHDLCALVASEQDAAHGAMCVDSDVIAAVEKDRSASLNRARALHAAGLAAYYGGAARDLTDWQVVIYLHLIRKDD